MSDDTESPTDGGGAGGGLGVAIVTITSTGSLDTDDAGEAVVAGFESEGHEIVTRELIAKDFDGVQSTISRLLDRDDLDVIVAVGGTGVEPDDVTVEAVRPLLEKDLPAFRDLFHRLSYEELGTSVVISRALGGVAEGTSVFCLPNDATAAGIATESIIVREADLLADLATGNAKNRTDEEPNATGDGEATSDGSESTGEEQ